MQKVQNQAAMMTGVKRMQIVDIEMPVLKKGEILIKMEYVGVCGSDVHFFETGKRKGKEFQLPFILGHEGSGTVMEISEGVTNLAAGDRVAIEPQQTCGRCEYCKSGRYNLCADVAFPSVPPYDGMLRRYFAFPAHLCFKLPKNVSTLEGALIEPLAVGFQAAKRGDVEIGKTIAIIGMGCIGLTTLLACKAMGALRVIGADLFEKRLQMAKSFGAGVVINAAVDEILGKVYEWTDGKGVDIVFETAGSKATASKTGSILKRGGVIVMVGNVEGQTPFDFMDLMYKEGEIRTIYRYKNNFPTTIEAVASGGIDVKGIVSDIFDFTQTQQAFDRVINDKQNVIKAVIQFD
jgi:L-iditol 2-dehydrogenase